MGNDVIGRVKDSSGFADIWLFLHCCPLGGSDNDLSKKAFVNASKNFNRDGVEVIGRSRVCQLVAYRKERSIINDEGW